MKFILKVLTFLSLFASCFPGFPPSLPLPFRYETLPLFFVFLIVQYFILLSYSQNIVSESSDLRSRRNVYGASCLAPSLLLCFGLTIFSSSADQYSSVSNVVLSLVGGSLLFVVCLHPYIRIFCLSFAIHGVLLLSSIGFLLEFINPRLIPSPARTIGVSGKIFATEPSTLTYAFILLFILIGICYNGYFRKEAFILVFLAVGSLARYFSLTLLTYISVALISVTFSAFYRTIVSKRLSTFQLGIGLLTFMAISLSPLVLVARPRFQELVDSVMKLRLDDFVAFTASRNEFRVLQFFSSYRLERLLGPMINCSQYDTLSISSFGYSICGASAPVPQAIVLHGFIGLVLSVIYLTLSMSSNFSLRTPPFLSRRLAAFLLSVLPGIIFLSMFVASSRSYPIAAFGLCCYSWLCRNYLH